MEQIEAMKAKASPRTAGGPPGFSNLNEVAQLAGWPTLTRADARIPGVAATRQGGDSLTTTADLAGWATPSATTWGGTPERHLERKAAANAAGHSMGMVVSNLDAQVQLAGWATPMAGSPGTEDYNPAGNTDSSRRTVELASPWATPCQRDYRGANAKPYSERGGGAKGEQLANQVVHSGPTATSSPAATGATAASRGALNPAFSLWLMGYPLPWLVAGLRAATTTRSRKGRSKAASAC